MNTNRTHAAAALLAAFALTIPFLNASDPAAKTAKTAKTAEEAPLVRNIKDLRKLNHRIVAMAGPSAAATVSIIANGGGGAGSGVIVSEDGIILTAAHVIEAVGDHFTVIFPDGSTKEAEALGADFDRDAAMARITEDGSYPHVTLGDSEELVRNDWCVALGHPGGFDPTRTAPVRLGRILRQEHFLITDSAVVGGDSGGPLFDADGLLIGIHSNIGTTLMQNRHVPIKVFKDKWDAMAGGERTGTRFAKAAGKIDLKRPVMGVRLGESGQDGGVEVTDVMENSPAGKAGLKKGDLITKINDQEVTGREELLKVVSKYKPGRKITVSFQRNGGDQEIEVQLVRLGDLMDKATRDEHPSPEESSEESPEESPEDSGNGDNKADGKEEHAKDKAEDGNDEGLKNLLAKAMKSGQLKLTPEHLKQLGGMAKLHELLKEFTKDIDPDARVQFRLQNLEPDAFYQASVDAMTPITRKAAASTVAVRLDGEPVALGTVVFRDDWMITKDTETRDGEVTVEIGGAEVPAKLVKRYPKRDLALFQVEAEGLKPIRWREAKKDLPVGSLLTSCSADGSPLGFGLLSVKTRALGGIGFLGISSKESEKGVLVVNIVKGSGADQAGIKKDDIITALNGEACGSPIDFGQHIRRLKAGQTIKLALLRGNEHLTFDVTLGERKVSRDPRFRAMNEMSGDLSARTDGFPMAIQHDIPLQPSECGGPLLDLGGRCVGINVARAGRVKTFAVPAKDLKELLADADPDAVATRLSEAEDGHNERQELLKALGDLQKQIEAIEERVKKLPMK